MTTKAEPQTVTGLHALAAQTLPFAKSLEVRSFLIERDEGNILVYSNEALGEDHATIESAGGVDRWFLGHWHEAMFVPDEAHDQLGTGPLVHEGDLRETADRVKVRGTFDRGFEVGDDFQVIPIPGHTPGSTAYLWSGRQRVLFTADSIILKDGEWVGALLDSSDRDEYLESLELLRGLDFDVLAPWGASRSGPAAVITDGTDSRERIGRIIERIEAGGTG